MPELPEVETIARDLRPLIAGAVIADARCDWPPVIRSHDPATFAVAIAGRRVETVGRRGKQLLVGLSGQAPVETADPELGTAGDRGQAEAGDRAPAESGDQEPSEAGDRVPAGVGDRLPAETRDPEPAVLTVHLKMTGQLFVVPAAMPKDRHVHLVFELADGRELRFRDIRKFGRVGLYRRDPTTGEPIAGEAVGVLASGAEPLDPAFTPALFRGLVARRRGRLKPLLLDQTFLAGVGNIYADESLWRARLHPLRRVSTLRADETRRLHRALRDVLAEAVERRGSSVDDYTAPEGDGSMQERLQVYQRAGEPCWRCGRPLRRIVVGGRSTHFCSWCQRLSAEERTSAARLLRQLDGDRAGRQGPRWSELSGDGVLGRTRDEEARAQARSDARARRVEAMRKAAATRRAAARGGG